MPCIAPKGEDDPEQQPDQNKSATPSLPTCRACRGDHKGGWHYEGGLKEDEEYFFVLVTPSNPTSFVGFSSIKRTGAQPQPRSTARMVPPLPDIAHSMIESQCARPPTRSGVQLKPQRSSYRPREAQDVASIHAERAVNVRDSGGWSWELGPESRLETMTGGGNPWQAQSLFTTKEQPATNAPAPTGATVPVGSFSKHTPPSATPACSQHTLQPSDPRCRVWTFSRSIEMDGTKQKALGMCRL